MEKCGGVFVKFGQLIALRVDLLPLEFCQELILLFDQVAPFPYSHVKKIFKEDLDCEIETEFISVDKTPLAAGSFAQVHRAILPDKREVVIKVQRPNIQNNLNIDLAILSVFIYFLGPLVKINVISLKEIFKEFREWTKKELDFQLEAVNCQKIYHNLKGSNLFVIPYVYPKFTSKHILVQDYLEGIPFTEILKQTMDDSLDNNKLLSEGINLHKVTHQIAFEMTRQYFIDGIYHGDPHPGNILLLKGGKIGLIDFGIVASVNADIRTFYNFMKAAVVGNDFKKAAFHLLELGSKKFIKNLQIILPEGDKGQNINDVINIMANNYYQSLKDLEYSFRGQLARKEIEYTSMFLKVVDFGSRYNIKLPKDLIMLLRAMSFLGIEMKMANENFRLTVVLENFFNQYQIDEVCLSGPREESFKPSVNNAMENIVSWISSIPEVDISLYKQIRRYFNLKDLSIA